MLRMGDGSVQSGRTSRPAAADFDDCSKFDRGVMLPGMSAPITSRKPIDPTLLASLRQRLGDRLSTSAAICEQHGKDESYHQPHSPDAVAFAASPDADAALV